MLDPQIYNTQVITPGLVNGFYPTHLCPFSKSKFNLFEAQSLTASTLLHQLVLSIELGTVQTGTGNIVPARNFKCTTASRDPQGFKTILYKSLYFIRVNNAASLHNRILLPFPSTSDHPGGSLLSSS